MVDFNSSYNLNKNRPFESLTLHIPKLEKYLLDAIRNSKYWSDL